VPCRRTPAWRRSPQLGIGQGKSRIFLGGGFKLFYRLKIFPLARQLHALVVIAQSLDGLSGRFEGLRLKFLDGFRAQRQVFFNGLR